MALGDPFVSIPELRNHAEIPDNTSDPELEVVRKAVTRLIVRHCGRDFNDAGEATERVYYPVDHDAVLVDDFSTVDGLIVKSDTTGDATYATTISSDDYSVEPLNGIVDGLTGFPYRWIMVHGDSLLMPTAGPPSVQVTARWGWAAVPADVKQACLLECARVFRRKFTPDGLLAESSPGVAGYAVRIPTKLDSTSRMLLEPYRIKSVLAGR